MVASMPREPRVICNCDCTGCPGVYQPPPGPSRPTLPNEVQKILAFIGSQKQMVSTQWLITQIKKGAHLR